MQANELFGIVMSADEPTDQIYCFVKDPDGTYIRYEIARAAALKEKGTDKNAIGLFLERLEVKEKENKTNESNFRA